MACCGPGSAASDAITSPDAGDITVIATDAGGLTGRRQATVVSATPSAVALAATVRDQFSGG